LIGGLKWQLKYVVNYGPQFVTLNGVFLMKYNVSVKHPVVCKSLITVKSNKYYNRMENTKVG